MDQAAVFDTLGMKIGSICLIFVSSVSSIRALMRYFRIDVTTVTTDSFLLQGLGLVHS